jgi:hypothetical protein
MGSAAATIAAQMRSAPENRLTKCMVRPPDFVDGDAEIPKCKP